MENIQSGREPAHHHAEGLSEQKITDQTLAELPQICGSRLAVPHIVVIDNIIMQQSGGVHEYSTAAAK